MKKEERKKKKEREKKEKEEHNEERKKKKKKHHISESLGCLFDYHFVFLSSRFPFLSRFCFIAPVIRKKRCFALLRENFSFTLVLRSRISATLSLFDERLTSAL
jgi:hypothetical protein